MVHHCSITCMDVIIFISIAAIFFFVCCVTPVCNIIFIDPEILLVI